MTKNQCKGLKPSQVSEEIRELFTAHIEIVGDPNLKWERLFRYLVMENQRFPADEPVAGILTDFFSALHGNEVDRFGSTIEAHLRAFGSWFPRYWQNVTMRRSAEALYTLPKVEPIPSIPKASETVTEKNWNLTRGLSILEIKRCVSIMDQINQAPDDKKNKPIKGVSGVDNFMARCRESIRRYESL